MTNDKLKTMLSFMKALDDSDPNNTKIPESKDYGITDQEYWDIIYTCQCEGFIRDADLRKGKNNIIIAAFLENTKLTIKGLEYLNENSAIMKTYKGLKEVREWFRL